MEIKIEGIVQEVRDGQVTKVKIEDQIFVPENEKRKFVQQKVEHKTIDEYQTKMDIKPHEKFIPTPKSKAYFKGKKVGNLRNNVIYENILQDVKEGMVQGHKYKQLEAILKSYYPNSNEASLHTYVNVYKRFINSGGKLANPVLPRKRRRRRRKPADAKGYSKTYKTWIREAEYMDVKRAINITRWGYRPHVIAISKELGMKQQRVRATLRYMLDNKVISSKVVDGKLVYQLV